MALEANPSPHEGYAEAAEWYSSLRSGPAYCDGPDCTCCCHAPRPCTPWEGSACTEYNKCPLWDNRTPEECIYCRDGVEPPDVETMADWERAEHEDTDRQLGLFG